MRNEFTAIFELDDSGEEPRYFAYCIEMHRSQTRKARRWTKSGRSCRDAIKSDALQARREKTLCEDILFDLPTDATQEVIAVQETISLY